MAGAGQGPSGVMVALATPATPDGAVDTAALEKLVARVVAGGVGGISPAGSTGEGAKLDAAQRAAVVRQVRACAPPGMPVIAGMPAVTPASAAAELGELAAAGASAVLVSPPSYYPLGDSAVLALYQALADRSPLPLLLYNIPVFTKVTIAPQVVAELAGHPQIAGMKDSSRDMEYLQQVVQASAGTDFSVLTGTDTLLVASLLAGARGTIAASANLVPQLPAGIYEAFTAGDLPRALEAQRTLSSVVAACRVGYFPAGWKAALALAGVCAADLLQPGTPLTGAQHAALAAQLDAVLPEVLAGS